MMSWCASYAQVRGTAAGEDPVPEKSSVAPEVVAGWSAAAQEQFETGREIAARLIASGIVGNSTKVFGVTLSGHANPGHEPAVGWANDCIQVSVYQTTPPD